MLLKNKTVAPWAIGVSRAKKGGQMMPADIIKVVPGLNQVKDADWEMLKSHPMIKGKIDSGDLEIVTDKVVKPKEEVEAHEEIAGMKAEEAVKAIKECYNKEQLEEMLEQEGRATVRRALEKQLQELEFTPEEKKKLGI